MSEIEVRVSSGLLRCTRSSLLPLSANSVPRVYFCSCILCLNMYPKPIPSERPREFPMFFLALERVCWEPVPRRRCQALYAQQGASSGGTSQNTT